MPPPSPKTSGRASSGHARAPSNRRSARDRSRGGIPRRTPRSERAAAQPHPTRQTCPRGYERVFRNGMLLTGQTNVECTVEPSEAKSHAITIQPPVDPHVPQRQKHVEAASFSLLTTDIGTAPTPTDNRRHESQKTSRHTALPPKHRTARHRSPQQARRQDGGTKDAARDTTVHRCGDELQAARRREQKERR